MLNKIIGFSIRNKLVIGMFVVGLIIYGIYELRKLPIDAVPDITNNQVQVITQAPSLGATDIERLVTFPIEQANSNIAGLEEIRSYSRFGLSLVTIVFEDGVDIYWARQQVTERLQQLQAEIPANIGTPELGPISTGLGEVYQYVVRPEKGYEDKYDITALRTIQDWIVRRQLLSVKGVAEVSSFGGKLKQFEVAVDPAKLQANNINIHDIFIALERNNENTGGAYIDEGNTVLYIRSEGLISNIDDIESIVIRRVNGTPLLIRDVADVRIGHAIRYGALNYNDQGEVSGAIVMMLKGANSNEVIQAIKERVSQVQETLPEGVVIEPFLDRTKMVDNAINTVKNNLLEGALIVVFVLVLFLGNLRAGFLVASVIPLAMLFAFIMMNVFGVSGNLMSLGALDFGLIVDGAVIIVEAVMHRLTGLKNTTTTKSFTQKQLDVEVEKSAGKMMNSAVFGQIIILIVYLPILSLSGIEGKMFKPMAQTVSFALIGAFILSLTYIPMMSAFLLKKQGVVKETMSDRVMKKIERRFKYLLEGALAHTKKILVTVIALFIVALVIFFRLGGEFIPSIEEGDFAVETRIMTGSNLRTTLETVNKVSHVLLERFPEVEKIVSKIGSSEVPTEPLPMDMGDMIINLKPKGEWTSANSFNELAEKMGEAANEVPGVMTSFQYPVQMRFNELMTGARQDVVCKIFGEDLDTLASYAQKLGSIAGDIRGTVGLYVEAVQGIPQITVQYNRAAIAQYGVSIDELNKTVNAAFAGQVAGRVFEKERRFDLVVRLNQNLRRHLLDVQQLLISTPSGLQIPLSQLAEVSLQPSPNQIQREDAKRRILVGFNVRGRDVEGTVKELQQKVNAAMKLPVGYYINYGGSFENLNEAKSRLSIAVPVALGLIFLLLYFAFGSIKHSMLIYTSIPLSAIGGAFLLAARGLPFSISAGVGFIALFGIAVLNGIVLIAEFNRIKARGESDLKKIVVEGATSRLRPVLMTASVASLGFLPMALSNGAGAEVQRPLATVVIGGLLLATFLTLFVLPILYILVERGFKLKSLLKKSVHIWLLLCLSGLATTAAAQHGDGIPLEVALDTALQNNYNLRSSELTIAYQEAMKGAAFDIAKTDVNAEYGQFNNNYNDNRFSVSQRFEFPTVYKRQKAFYEAGYRTAVANKQLEEAEIIRQVSLTYYAFVYLDQKQRILDETDQIYEDFLRVASLRLETGESNALEHASAETQRTQIAIQKEQLHNDKRILQAQWQWLLNSKQFLAPKIDTAIQQTALVIDTAELSQHPQVRVASEQLAIAHAQTRLTKASILPEVMAGYNNMSLLELDHTSLRHRFHSVQVGLAIPLFYGAQRAKIKAAGVQEKRMENELAATQLYLSTQYREAIENYNKYMKAVQAYEKRALKNADLIQRTAKLQFTEGEINFMEWTVLNNQALTIRTAYIDAIRNLNNSVITLNYLSTQN
ncbi:CusA/CzcA family heavy metal efflux RND transporter [Olivibacter sp. SDN3]|uniref:CusA/CzcA family heavy metal efflux RND transporter n=1 Tax=Olivibacter sp. SDN3 TaxID=2764720 RepID=UPI0016513999|nr:CusA/CzcA family heavy metal efflux RND transporter [Olivibacter sp. SDN3]QNL49912.1 CusA/CzcA family heavy metal efflux RND transporter [Olivibacter sp. SDN3]